jgi:glycosyltransferase involved in cell wall biosynthesis
VEVAGKAPALQSQQLAVVIPARNEARSIRDLAKACCTYARWVIIVDDASSDGTSEAVEGLPLTVLRSATQLGKGGALAWGFRVALEHGARAIITLDGDGQHDPHDIPAFVAAANQHSSHLIIGARVKAASCAPRLRRAANRIADFWVSWAAGQRVTDSQSGHRLYPRELLLTVHAHTSLADSFAFESEMLIESARRAFDITAVPIETRYPHEARASHFRPMRDIWRITRMIFWKTTMGRWVTRHSQRPPWHSLSSANTSYEDHS